LSAAANGSIMTISSSIMVEADGMIGLAAMAFNGPGAYKSVDGKPYK
jgi:hypothetical protein